MINRIITLLIITAIIVIGAQHISLGRQVTSLEAQNTALNKKQDELVSTINKNNAVINQLLTDRVIINEITNDFINYKSKVDADTRSMLFKIEQLRKTDPVNNRPLSPVLKMVVTDIVGGNQ